MEYIYKWIIDFEDFCTFSVLYILKEHILQHLEEKSKCHFFFSTGIMVLKSLSAHLCGSSHVSEAGTSE